MANFDNLPEDSELKFELYAVYRDLQNSLDEIDVHILEDDECNIHEDLNDIDDDQLVEDCPAAAGLCFAQEPEGVIDIDCRDYGLLHGEPCYLNAFQNAVSMHIFLVVPMSRVRHN